MGHNINITHKENLYGEPNKVAQAYKGALPITFKTHKARKRRQKSAEVVVCHTF